MTTITAGMTPTQFLAAINANLLTLYGIDNFTSMVSKNQLDFDADLNTNLSRSDTYVGRKGSSYENLLNSNFTNIYHLIFDTAFINTLAHYAIGALNLSSGYYYNGITYLIFASYSDDPYIITYTHANNTWSDPVRVGINELGDGDGHGEPAMLIDNDGYIHVMWGAHSTAIKYSKSTNSEDITEWTAMSSPAIGTYPQLLQFSDDTIYLFHRDALGNGWGFQTSVNGGISWSALSYVHYDLSYILAVKGVGDTIHLISLGYPPTTNINRPNVYYLFFNGTNWENIKGDTISLAVSHTSDILVYEAAGRSNPNACFAFDSTNKPYILFTDGVNEIGTYTYKFAKHNGVSWDIYNLGVTTDFWRDFATALDCISLNHFDAYIVTGGTADTLGGNIEKWTSIDGGVTWSRITTLITGQFIDPVMIKNYNVNARVLMCEINDSWTNKGCLYGDSGFIGKRIDN